MKKYFIVLFLLFISCKYDNFYETDRELKLDKDIYNIGDEIKITMIVSPHKYKKDIRIYENYKNIDFSFSIINDGKDIYNEFWSSPSGQNMPISKIKKLTITKEKPLIVKFIGKIYIEKDYVFISFPNVNNYTVKLKKELIQDSNSMIRILGVCNPINPELGASFEEHFNTIDFKIKLE